MANDVLPSVLRQRRVAVDEARRALGSCIRAEISAQQQLQAAQAAIQFETHFASCLAADDSVVESFACWLTAARARETIAEAALAERRAQTAEARAILALARGSLRGAECFADQRLEAAASESRRGEQRDLDEVASQRSLRPYQGKLSSAAREK